MVGSALGVWDAPVSRREFQQEAETLLAQVPLFSGLSRRQLGQDCGGGGAQALPRKRRRSCAPARRVMRSTSSSTARPGRTPGWSCRSRSGPFFGEMAIIDGAPRSATVSAVTDIVVLVIPAREVPLAPHGRAESRARDHDDARPAAPRGADVAGLEIECCACRRSTGLHPGASCDRSFALESRQGAARAFLELIPELREHLAQVPFHGTALMKSCAPISGFERPSRASRAICSSCGVRSSRVSSLPLAHLHAGGDQLAACTLREALGAH